MLPYEFKLKLVCLIFYEHISKKLLSIKLLSSQAELLVKFEVVIRINSNSGERN